MPNGVLDGTAPLQRANGAGGVQGQMEDFVTQKFGKKVRLAGFGGKRPRFFEDMMDFYFMSISNPVKDLSTDFKDYYDWMKKTKEREVKEKKGGILKQLHSFAPHFFDFKVWKKITGQARDPQIAALHQIRDVLIKAHDLDKDVFGRDPRELFIAVTDQFKYFRRKFGIEEGGIAGVLKTTGKFFKEAYQERKAEDQKFFEANFGPKVYANIRKQELIKESQSELQKQKKKGIFGKGVSKLKDIFGLKEFIKKDYRDYKDQIEALTKQAVVGKPMEKPQKTMYRNVQDIRDMIVSENTISVAITKNKTKEPRNTEKMTEGISDQLRITKEQLDTTKDIDKDRRFHMFKAGKEKRKEGSFLKKLLGRFVKIGLLSGLAFMLFGKKGAIAVAAAGFFLKILPQLLWKGLRGMFSLATKGISSLGKFAMKIITNPKAALKLLGTKAKAVGAVGAKAGAVAGGAGIFAGLTLHDLMKEGGGLEQIKKGEIGKGVSSTLLGSDMAEATPKEVAMNVGKQALKYGGLGAAIGSVVPGVGTAIGAGVGAAVGGIGATVKALWEKGIIQKWWKTIKTNKMGAIMGGLLGSFVMPGVGTIIGTIGGAWIQKKIRDPRFREKVVDAAKLIWEKIKMAGSWIKDKFTLLKDKFVGHISKNKVGSIIGGVIGSVVPGPGTVLGMMAGGFLEKKLRDFNIMGKIEGLGGVLVGQIKEVFADPKKIISKLINLKSRVANSLKEFFVEFFKALPKFGGVVLKFLGLKSFTSKDVELMESEEKAEKIRKENLRRERENREKETKLIKVKEEREKKIAEAERQKIAFLKGQIMMLDGIDKLGDIFKKKQMNVVQSTTTTSPRINQES